MVLDRFSLEGQVGIITGGGAGLGKEYCRACSSAGAGIVMREINRDTGQSHGSEVAGQGHEALFVETDVCDPQSIQNMVDTVVDRFGKIDFLVNNAGMWIMGDIENTTEESWNRVMDLNINGLFFCCQQVGQHMVGRGKGSIINISSVSGVIIDRAFPTWLEPSYYASKSAVIHLTKALAAQWAEHNVRANVIAPGYMAMTPFDPTAPEPAWLDWVPLKRPGRPDELGPAAVFLASEASSYITGQVILVDGGYSIY